jgi:hypothetical protein
MKSLFFGSLAVLTILSGCASLRGGGASTAGTDVTRFHLGQPIARASIAVEAFEPADANSPEFRSYATAVGQELTRLGWTVVPAPGRSEQVALIDVAQGAAPRLRVGAGGSVRPVDANSTQLEVRLMRRSDRSVIWEGRAEEVNRGQTSPEQRITAVQRLASALFRDFPGESGRTIRLR